MLIHHDPSFTIYFGEQSTSVSPAQCYTPHVQEQFSKIIQELQLDALLVLEQTHCTIGYNFALRQDCLNYQPYSREGDYLITSVKNVGLGISTADCLPIILYDPKNKVIALVHAGWRGTVNGITLQAIQHMYRDYGTAPRDIQAFFGPAAGVCCYEVDKHFGEQIENMSVRECTILFKKGKYYFDNTLYNQLMLENLGVPSQAINTEYGFCTMEDERFCSYRREREQSRRQMTIVSLI